MRWPQGVCCQKRGCEHVVRNGHDETRPHRQRYQMTAMHDGLDAARKSLDVTNEHGVNPIMDRNASRSANNSRRSTAG
jgi:hypothetical protein